MRIKNMKGIHTSPKSEFKKGHKFTPETIKKMIKAKIGHIPWNKNKEFPQIRRNKHFNWKGGRIIHSNGYIRILNPEHPHNDGGYVYEHRLIIEKIIKRFLLPIEEVHHLNKIIIDNRPNNLMAFVNHSAHFKFEFHPNKIKPTDIIFDGRKYH